MNQKFSITPLSAFKLSELSRFLAMRYNKQYFIQTTFMYIHRGLLLIIVMAFVFSPAIIGWITNNPTAWYRPFLAWLLMIILAYGAQRYASRKERHD